MPLNATIPDPTTITSWSQALVAVVLIAAILIVPAYLSYKRDMRVRVVENTLSQTTESGDETVMDMLINVQKGMESVQDSMTDLDRRLTLVEQPRPKALPLRG